MTYGQLWRSLATIYPAGEAKAIARYVFDVRFGMSATDVYCGKDTLLTADECRELDDIAARLMRHEPVQYVLGRADFCGRTFAVAPGVLIPRPETEDLCDMIIDRTAAGSTVLDIGTGSGCIAVTLALGIAGAHVSAWDISDTALDMARLNAAVLGAQVDFALCDALSPPADSALWDVVVSNPPYICDRERAAMAPNVTDYEPHTALFVPDSDPLLFYRAIARYAAAALKPSGKLYFEINAAYGTATADMLRSLGYGHVEVAEDRFGKVRIVTAEKQHRMLKTESPEASEPSENSESSDHSEFSESSEFSERSEPSENSHKSPRKK